MIVPRLIERKRDGERLEPREIRELVLAYATGTVPDYQMAALLMAVYFRGLDREEMNALMDAMLESGNRLDLTRLPMPRIDKHSTGGVGDNALILAQLIARRRLRFGCRPGLCHTVELSTGSSRSPVLRHRVAREAEKQIASIGCAMLSQTDEIVPADRRIYALRDATATVEVIPLIAASIMSKKIAESLTGLVLDIKRGAGAFMPKLDDELELAKAMIDLGARHACPVVALLTAMDRPLGHACGNALEMHEAIEVLKGGGPQDLIDVTLALGAEMLFLAALATSQEAARVMMRDAISSGRALLKLEEIVRAQGGDAAVVRDPSSLPQAPHKSSFNAKHEGVVQSVDPRAVGYGVISLGGGRQNMEDKVDPSVGFVITAKPGLHVTKGQSLATIHARSREELDVGKAALERAIVIGHSAPIPLPLVSHRVTARGVEALA